MPSSACQDERLAATFELAGTFRVDDGMLAVATSELVGTLRLDDGMLADDDTPGVRFFRVENRWSATAARLRQTCIVRRYARTTPSYNAPSMQVPFL
jgi:hypothetical protein